MHNQRTLPLQATRADARFNALVKKEMEEHQHLISSHHKEMQALRDIVKLAMEKCESLSRRNEQDLKEFKEHAERHLSFLSDRVLGNELYSAEQKKSILSLHADLSVFYESYSSREAIEQFKKSMEMKIAEATMNHLIAFQECQREFKALFKALNDDLEKFKESMADQLSDISSKGEEKFSLSQMNKEGVMRELSRYKKAVFYIEKKIENIYTLIERINKREGA